VPAGVMGRPSLAGSLAGSCWHKAPAQKAKQIKRKTLLLARDFIGLLP